MQGAVGALLLNCVAIVGLYAVWFELSWAWNYARAPLETRVRYDPARVTPQAAEALQRRAIVPDERAGRTRARARERAARSCGTAGRMAAGGAARRRHVGSARRRSQTDRGRSLHACHRNGTASSTRLRSTWQLASDLFWFERPFDYAHEWSHVAAYAREDEANYLAIVTCLRSQGSGRDAYAGWFALFLYLPQKRHYARREFVPLVWRDFAAIRAAQRAPHQRDARALVVAHV